MPHNSPDEQDEQPPVNSESDQPPGFWKRRPVKLLMRIFFWYAVLVVMITFLQRSLIYHPKTATGEFLEAALKSISVSEKETVKFTTTDQVTLHGWYLRSDFGNEPSDNLTVLYFPGNAGNRSYRSEICSLLLSENLDVLIFDYRGYGDNSGSPSEKKFYADAKAAWNFATGTLEIPADRIIVFGESLGGGVAVQLTHQLCRENSPPAALILQATFSSLTDVAAEHFPWLPVRWVLWDRFPSIQRMPDITVPYLHLHGTADTVVNYEFGKRLFDAAPMKSTVKNSAGIPKTLVSIENAGHNNLLLEYFGTYRQSVSNFLSKLRSRGH